MEKEKYRPRLPFLFVIIFVAIQFWFLNYLQRDFETKIQQCQEAINTNSILNSALINMLAEKKIIEKNDLLNEAQKLTLNLKDMVDKMQLDQKHYKEYTEKSDNKTN
jgi:hypothetical protein